MTPSCISFTPTNSALSLEKHSPTFTDILSWMNLNKLLLTIPTLANNLVSSVNFRILLTTFSSISSMKMINTGPNTDPWGTPLSTFSHPDTIPLMTTCCHLSDNQFPIHLTILSSSPAPTFSPPASRVKPYRMPFGNPNTQYQLAHSDPHNP